VRGGDDSKQYALNAAAAAADDDDDDDDDGVTMYPLHNCCYPQHIIVNCTAVVSALSPDQSTIFVPYRSKPARSRISTALAIVDMSIKQLSQQEAYDRYEFAVSACVRA
jgi:hypothetical protein